MASVTRWLPLWCIASSCQVHRRLAGRQCESASHSAGKAPLERLSGSLTVWELLGRSGVSISSAMRARTLLCLAAAALTACGSDPGPHQAAMGHGHGSGQLQNFQMIDASNGWSFGRHFIGRTADGAATFIDVTPPGVDAKHQLESPDFLDSQKAWVIVGPPAGATEATLDRTQDGGATWTQTPISSAYAGAPLHFVDSQHGWLTVEQGVGNHTALEITLLRTTDGGFSWSEVYRTTQRLTIEPNVQTGDCGWLSGVDFISPLAGFAGVGCPGSEMPSIAITRDGGRTWQRVPLPSMTKQPGVLMASSVNVLKFFSPLEGVAFVSSCFGDGQSCQSYGALYRTLDGGHTWSSGSVVRVGASGTLAVDPSNAWLPYGCLSDCSRPFLLRTTDGGNQWIALELPAELAPNMHATRSFQFVTPQLGFVISTGGGSFPGMVPQPKFYRTTDGGRTFEAFMPRVL